MAVAAGTPDWAGEPVVLEAVACVGAGDPEPWKSFWKSMDLAGVPLPEVEALSLPPAKPMVVFFD